MAMSRRWSFRRAAAPLSYRGSRCGAVPPQVRSEPQHRAPHWKQDEATEGETRDGVATAQMTSSVVRFERSDSLGNRG